MFVTNFVQDSPTISLPVGEDLGDISHKAVAFTPEGKVTLATEGASAMGVALSTCTDISSGDFVDVLVKDIGLLQVAESVACGDFVTINEEGLGKKATSGTAVFGRAFTSGDVGASIQVQISPCGAYLGG